MQGDRPEVAFKKKFLLNQKKPMLYQATFGVMTKILQKDLQTFCYIGESLARKIPDSGSNFDKYLGASIVENFIFKSITEKDLLDVAKSLRPKSSFGADLLSTKFLKEILPSLAKPICHLFNLSLHTGYIPP